MSVDSIGYPRRMVNDLFRTFRQGAAWLWAFPAWTWSLVLLGTGLQALAPWLQMQAGLPENLLVTQTLIYATTLPLTLYAMPRYVLFLDATVLNSPLNPQKNWAETFESRWVRLLGAKILVGLGVLVGFFALVIPGLMIWAAFGWAPTLVLTRGFDLKRAFRGSLRIMAVHAPKIIFTVLGATLLLLVISMGAASFLPGEDKDFTPLFRLRHPLVWVFNALETLSGVWLSATLLALFHQIEAPAGEAEIEDADEDD